MPNFNQIYELCQTAYPKYLEKKIINNIKLKTDIYIQCMDRYIKIPKDYKENLNIYEINQIDKNSKFVIYRTDPRLLRLLLKGPRYAHWNNADQPVSQSHS